ncbi:MAG TPA: sigma-70 family RNA polymerase sigma factor [Pirellulales bacterium]|nr:sigma-70 family RNA polymerase sigma factor [Pirellulales bacterium]
MDAASTSDVELAGRTRAGDRSAFAVLVARHQAAVCAVAYAIVGDVGRSEDVAQDAFLAAWRQVGELADLAKFKAWVCGIARNLALAAVRRERKNQSLDESLDVPAPGPTPAERAISHEEESLVWTALTSLPDTYREPLVLFYREQESIAGVATALNLSEAAVKQRLSRGRDMLRADLIAMIEAALKRSGPGTAFTAVVLAALPGIGSATASAATAAGIGKSALPAAKVASSVAASAAGGTLLGIAGAMFGTYCGWQSARYQRERDFYRRAISVYTVGLAIFIAPFAALGLGWWTPQAIGRTTYLIWFSIWMLGFFAASGFWTWRMVRGWKRIVAEQIASGAPELEMTPLRRWQSRWVGRQWTSELRLLGLPLIDIRFSDPHPTPEDILSGKRRMPAAVAWIALGDRAYGVLFASGNVAVGGIAFGAVTVGLVSVGGIAIGGLAFGGLGLGVIGVGGLGAGLFAVGGLALGWLAFGGSAIAWRAAKGGSALAHDFAVGGSATAAHANDEAAAIFVEQSPFFEIAEQTLAATNGLPGWTFTAILAVAVCAFLRIAYYRRPIERA